MNYSREDVFILFPARVGLMHIGVFILLLLSGERNFGVRLNKPYSVRVPMDIPVFTGTHADFLIIVSDLSISSMVTYAATYRSYKHCRVNASVLGVDAVWSIISLCCCYL